MNSLIDINFLKSVNKSLKAQPPNVACPELNLQITEWT